MDRFEASALRVRVVRLKLAAIFNSDQNTILCRFAGMGGCQKAKRFILRVIRTFHVIDFLRLVKIARAHARDLKCIHFKFNYHNLTLIAFIAADSLCSEIRNKISTYALATAAVQ